MTNQGNHNMKRTLIAAALMLVGVSAHATYCKDGSLIASHPNGNCAVPITGPAPTAAPSAATSSSVSGAAANANASAASKSSASSGSTATGGNSRSDANGGAGGSSSIGSLNAGNDSSQTSFRALALSLPSPVFTPPMPLASCPQANVEQEAHAVGWNFYSQAHGSVNTDNCTAIIVYNAMLDQCQYESAQNVLDGLMSKVMPNYKTKPMSGLNLSAKECYDLKNPPAVPVNFVASAPATVTPAVCPIAHVAKKRIVKRSAAMITECKP